jgi:hypothetical protein
VCPYGYGQRNTPPSRSGISFEKSAEKYETNMQRQAENIILAAGIACMVYPD